MTVKDLIYKLSQSDQDLDVKCCAYGSDILDDAYNVFDIAQITLTDDSDSVIIRYES